MEAAKPERRNRTSFAMKNTQLCVYAKTCAQQVHLCPRLGTSSGHEHYWPDYWFRALTRRENNSFGRHQWSKYLCVFRNRRPTLSFTGRSTHGARSNAAASCRCENSAAKMTRSHTLPSSLPRLLLNVASASDWHKQSQHLELPPSLPSTSESNSVLMCRCHAITKAEEMKAWNSTPGANIQDGRSGAAAMFIWFAFSSNYTPWKALTVSL